MTKEFSAAVNITTHPINDLDFISECKYTLDSNGVLVLPGFLKQSAIDSINKEAENQKHLAFYTTSKHNIYLTQTDPQFENDHVRNRLMTSSKGCITTDQIPQNSALNAVYKSKEFKYFLCQVLGETQLYEYADTLSSINLHYADDGQELGWHFDNSSFAITLMIQKPTQGGEFEYVKNARNADDGEMGFNVVEKVLEGKVKPDNLSINPGDLVLFRGQNSMHRVTPVIGNITRKLAVMAYNSKPGVSLSESARMTFFGRLG